MNDLLAMATEIGVVVPATALLAYGVKELIGLRERLARIEQKLSDIAENCPDCEGRGR